MLLQHDQWPFVLCMRKFVEEQGVVKDADARVAHFAHQRCTHHARADCDGLSTVLGDSLCHEPLHGLATDPAVDPLMRAPLAILDRNGSQTAQTAHTLSDAMKLAILAVGSLAADSRQVDAVIESVDECGREGRSGSCGSRERRQTHSLLHESRMAVATSRVSPRIISSW